MNGLIKRYIYLLIAVIILLIAVFTEYGLFNKNPENNLISRFQEKLLKKELTLDSYLNKIFEVVSDKAFSSDYQGGLYSFKQEMKEEGLGILIYDGDRLVYWSDRTIAFNEFNNMAATDKRILLLPNGYYYFKQKQYNNLKIYGLFLLKHNYPHENEYLHNSFQESFKFPKSYRIKLKHSKGNFAIHDNNGEYLFSILPAGQIKCTRAQLFYPGALYVIALIFTLLYVRCEFKNSKRPVAFRLFVLGGGLFIFYWFHMLFQFPRVFYEIGFFSPEHFAFSLWLPSFGDFWLMALFFCFWALNFSLNADIRLLIIKSELPKKFVVFLVLFSLGGVYLFVDYLIKILVENSSFSLSLTHIIALSVQSIIAYFSIALLLLGLAMLTIKIIDNLRRIIAPKTCIIIALLVAALLATMQLLSASTVSVAVIVLFLIFIIILFIFTIGRQKNYMLSYLITLASIFSVYSLFIIYTTISEKEQGFQRTYAFNLVTEHDPAAEILITSIQEQINIDSIIPTLLIPSYEVQPNLENYLRERYFSGYFREYDLQVLSCTGGATVFVEPDNVEYPCYPFFDEKIEREGLILEGTNFYFLDNMNGRITYFGKLNYPIVYDSLGMRVFIELNSKIVSEGIGYPELLLDESMKKPENYSRFQYSKYNGGQIVDQHGDFLYNKYLNIDNMDDEEFIYRKWGGYEHLIYHTQNENYVIVSREIYGLGEYLISFPYIFVFYFMLTVVFLLIGSSYFRKRSVTFDLRFKVQSSIISIVLLSLLTVAIATILYNIDTYKSKHREDLNEKMKSITEEIEMRKERVENLTDENLSWLFRELEKLSNVFRTDINVYDIDGELIATSRTEVYDKGLISTKMNPEAYYELFHNFNLSYIQPERIGEHSYLSAYRPIFSDAGSYIGFINLPYFTRQDRYSQEITTFIMAFLNLYVVFFLVSIIVAVFIANQITKPLTLIRDNLHKIELGKRSKPIDYPHDDEIGSLVKEYNKKVDELAVSAELLARSERESAWREMAKQIAHEIKNPLTPMKLNIQYLQRLKNEPKQLEGGIDKISKLLIGQIDTLSAIATEFSNFAKIPKARNQIFNLPGQLKKSIDLFEANDKAIIQLKINCPEDILVNADREQFSRAIINLVKNAIQAIPDDQEGLINIALSKNAHIALIEVSDNGAGIAEELQDKLFSPSFTTKTSGMGLGLAIVKNIVENFKGRIWFKTRQGAGTSFFVEIPVFENNNVKENENNSIE